MPQSYGVVRRGILAVLQRLDEGLKGRVSSEKAIKQLKTMRGLPGLGPCGTRWTYASRPAGAARAPHTLDSWERQSCHYSKKPHSLEHVADHQLPEEGVVVAALPEALGKTIIFFSSRNFR